MPNKFIITDGAKATNAENLLLSDDPSVWTYFSGQPRADDVKLYAKVAAVYSAYNLTADTVGNMPFALVDKSGEDFDTSATWENKVKFLPNPSELFRLDTLSYIATNTFYNLRTSDILGYNKTRGLYHAVAYSFYPYTDPVTGELLHVERWVGAQREIYQPDDERLIRAWRLDHTTEVLPSENTEARAIMTAAGEIHYADVWIENFYRRGGIKPTLIAMKGLINPDKKGDEEKKWSQWLRGIGQWFTNIARVYNAEALDVKAFGDGVADLENNEIYRQAIANIAMAMRMPLSLLLANSANYATAKEEKISWYENKITPLCNWIAYEYNRQVFEPLGLRLEFRPETIEGAQKDEAATAQAFSIYGDTFAKYPTYELWKGMADTLGLEISDSLDKAAKEYYADKEKQAELVQQQMAQNPQQQPGRAQTPAGQVPQVEAEPEEDDGEEPKEQPPAKWIPSLDEYKELDVWRDVALRKLKRGESLEFEYTPHYGGLPDEITKTIKAKLLALYESDEYQEGQIDADDIKAIFRVETVEAKPPSEILILAEALNNYAKSAAFVQPVKAEPVLPAAPNVNITMPAISLTAQMPEQGTVVVNVPEQAPPVVNVTNEVQPAPVEVKNEVTVKPAPVNVIDRGQRTAKVKRDRNGNISEIVAE